jgi:hypothetical protein
MEVTDCMERTDSHVDSKSSNQKYLGGSEGESQNIERQFEGAALPVTKRLAALVLWA